MTVRGEFRDPTDHYALEIEGHLSAMSIHRIEGGYTKTALTEESFDGKPSRIKHQAHAELEPLTIEFGLAGSADMLKWIQGALRKTWPRRNTSLYRIEADGTVGTEYDGADGILTEVSFPRLDKSSKADLFVKVKIQYEHMLKTKPQPAKQDHHFVRSKAKTTSVSAFQFTIDGLSLTGKEATVIEPFAIKLGTKRSYTGNARFPSYEPTKVEFPDLTVQLPATAAAPLQGWAKELEADGAMNRQSKTGRLEFMSGSKVLLGINLYDIVLKSVSSKTKSPRSTQAAFAVGRMDLDGPGGLSLDG